MALYSRRRGGESKKNMDSDTSDGGSDSDRSDADVNASLATATKYMKPNVGNKSIIAPQSYAARDVSEKIILKGNSRYLFLKDQNTRKGLVVHYRGKQAKEGGRDVGDLFNPDTIRRCHLTPWETRLFERTFLVTVDGVVSLTKHRQRMEWRERLITYFILLESNMFSTSIDVNGKEEKQEFLYRFAMLRSRLDQGKVDRVFKRRMSTSTPTARKQKKRRKLSTNDLLGVSKQLGLPIMTLAPPEAFTVAQGLEATKQLGLRIMTLVPVEKFSVAQGLEATK